MKNQKPQNDFTEFEKAKNELMNEIYKLFKIPQIVEWLAKRFNGC